MVDSREVGRGGRGGLPRRSGGTFAVIDGNRTATIHDYHFMNPLGGVVLEEVPVSG
ncbi:hypothetical protein O7635_36965 [Asanoa sp. WMMD1127]|uniref:hypothetical protein n=1 Tax=Asanoa sp. WMMD1127 TaxID=3016107 RepID=UPI002417B0D9|nr:hypothetical protein [Asanoa sp. WMMD1127]MDG4827468.1 hypothetical protein [Asanoa sp. WMMD1127]